jgi:glutamate 5-kinase
MTSTKIRQNTLSAARRVVVKLGTQVLTSSDPGRRELDLPFIRGMAGQVAALHERGFEVTVVSSGAIGAGCMELGLDKRPRYVADQQAVAAVGQRLLMTYMHDAFASHGLQVGQVLLTRGAFDDRVRYLNIRNCVTRLHRFGCVPILNENDAVSVDELRFGDNDMLAALVCNALRADALVMLTVVDGLLDATGHTIDLVRDVGQIKNVVRGATSELGSGGMSSKLEAVRMVTEAGEVAVIANGREPDVLRRLFDAQPLGTLFVPTGRKLSSRHRWIGLTKRPAGTVTIDDGAARALTSQGKSLLAIGITAVSGRFERGQLLTVRDTAGHEIARGLSNYAASEVRKIMGKRSNQFEKLLGRQSFSAVIHRDNLTLTGA